MPARGGWCRPRVEEHNGVIPNFKLSNTSSADFAGAQRAAAYKSYLRKIACSWALRTIESRAAPQLSDRPKSLAYGIVPYPQMICLLRGASASELQV